MATKPTKKVTRLYGMKHTNSKPSGYNRVRSADEYHTSRWTRLSRIFRQENPLCAICESKGILKPAEVVTLSLILFVVIFSTQQTGNLYAANVMLKKVIKTRK